MSVVFRRAVPPDFPDVLRITREAYLRAGHFSADHPYMSVLEDVEHRAEHAQVWVAEAAGRVVAAVTLTFAGQQYSEIAKDGELEFRMLAVDPAHQGKGLGRAVVREVVEHARELAGIEAISITSTSTTFMERAHSLYESLGFRRAPERDWYVPGDVLLCVFTMKLYVSVVSVSAPTGGEPLEDNLASGSQASRTSLASMPGLSARLGDAHYPPAARNLTKIVRQERHFALIGPLIFGAFAVLGIFRIGDIPGHLWFCVICTAVFTALAMDANLGRTPSAKDRGAYLPTACLLRKEPAAVMARPRRAPRVA